VVQAVDSTAAKLGNTRAVVRAASATCIPRSSRRSGAGVTIESPEVRAAGPRRANFSSQEAAVLALLRAKSGEQRAKERRCKRAEKEDSEGGVTAAAG
jgi:hypothetical protein